MKSWKGKKRREKEGERGYDREFQFSSLIIKDGLLISQGQLQVKQDASDEVSMGRRNFGEMRPTAQRSDRGIDGLDKNAFVGELSQKEFVSFCGD